MPPRAKPGRSELQFSEYADQEISVRPDGQMDRLMTPEELMERWGVASWAIKEARLGLSGRKVRLKSVAISPRVFRYRARDVLEYEWHNMTPKVDR